MDLDKILRIAVIHNTALEEARKIVARIEREIKSEEIILSIVSPALGVRTGPRAVALRGYAT